MHDPVPPARKLKLPYPDAHISKGKTQIGGQQSLDTLTSTEVSSSSNASKDRGSLHDGELFFFSCIRQCLLFFIFEL